MKTLIKYLLKFHRETLMTEIIADYFNLIPQKITDEAISILKEKRPRIDKWIAFQALTLQRRMVNDPKNPQITFGMLLQLKLISHMISGGQTLQEEVENTQPSSGAQEERERKEELQKSIEGARAFKNKKK